MKIVIKDFNAYCIHANNISLCILKPILIQTIQIDNNQCFKNGYQLNDII